MANVTTYTNVTLVGVPQDEAVSWLAENGYRSVVSPTIEDITVVFDNILNDLTETEEPLEALLKLVSEISYELACIALLCIADEDIVFTYTLYDDGNLIDSYGVHQNETPQDGNAETVIDAFGLPKRHKKEVRSVLRIEGISATERHTRLYSALQIPLSAVGCSYSAILDGDLPNGVSHAEEMVFIEPNEEDENTAV